MARCHDSWHSFRFLPCAVDEVSDCGEPWGEEIWWRSNYSAPTSLYPWGHPAKVAPSHLHADVAWRGEERAAVRHANTAIATRAVETNQCAEGGFCGVFVHHSRINILVPRRSILWPDRWWRWSSLWEQQRSTYYYLHPDPKDALFTGV